jgi:ABC-type lipoprotein export system ATPase subunit
VSGDNNKSTDKKELTLKVKKVTLYVLFSIIVIALFFREAPIFNEYFFLFKLTILSFSLLIVLCRVSISIDIYNLLKDEKVFKPYDIDSAFYRFWNNKNQVIYFFLLLLPLFIPNELVNNFVDNIVSQIFQDSKTTIYSIILITASSCFLLIGYVRSKSVYIPSKTPLALLFLISSWVAYYEITSTYEYLTFSGGVIHLTSFIYLMTYLNLHFYLKFKYGNTKTQNNEPPSLLTDEEIGLTNEEISNKHEIIDKLGRKDYAERLTKKLLKGSFKTSFAVGITGEWGAGKTSFISLMKESLRNTDKDIIILEFNPWNSQTSSQIIEDFFGVFQKKLSPYSSTISSEIMNYAKNLIHSNKGYWWTLPKQIINYFDKPISIGDRFSHINENLKIINKKIFIIIDDLDRLDKKEIIEVIRLIRNTANFYNMRFIVGYDKGYVNAAIASINDYRSEFFLEKIFQLEIVLPHVESNFYIEKLIEKIEIEIGDTESGYLLNLHKKALAYNRDRTFLDNQNAYNFYFIISSIIDSYRDISRFINILTLNYEGVKDDVNFIHFILVEALRYKYPLVIDSMHKQRDKLFSFDRENNLVSLNDYDATKSTLTITISEENFQTITKKITKEVKQNSNLRQLFDKYIKKESIDSTLNSFLSEFTLNEADKNIITLFFKLIFVDYPKNTGHLLNHPKYYSNYFSYRNSKDSIPRMEFEKAIKDTKSVNEFNVSIDAWLNTNKKNIEDCFYNYSPTDYKTYKTYILGFLYAAKKMKFNTRMDRVLENKLPDLTLDDNKNKLRDFFDKEFVEASNYPFVEELVYLNKIIKIHFNEEVEYNKELRELERTSNSHEEIFDFEGSHKLSKINLFLIITNYEYYIEKFIEKTAKVKDLKSEEFKSFFKQVAGDKGWFRFVGYYDNEKGKEKFQKILKEFIEKHSEDDVYEILLESIQEEQEIDSYGRIYFTPFEANPYIGICSLFNDYDEFYVFFKKLKYDKMKNEKDIENIYWKYYEGDKMYYYV